MVQHDLQEFLPSRTVLVYPVLNLSLAPAASRFLSATDAILPFASLKLCAQAYVPPSADPLSDPLLSPGLTSSTILASYPPTVIVAAQLDPLLDEALTFARRLKTAGCDVTFAAMPDCPHAFLHVGHICGGDVARGIAYVISTVANTVSNVVTMRITTGVRNQPHMEVPPLLLLFCVFLALTRCRLRPQLNGPFSKLSLRLPRGSMSMHHL